eukprot:730-Chlamydomonas_euryale.AAC.7
MPQHVRHHALPFAVAVAPAPMLPPVPTRMLTLAVLLLPPALAFAPWQVDRGCCQQTQRGRKGVVHG